VKKCKTEKQPKKKQIKIKKAKKNKKKHKKTPKKRKKNEKHKKKGLDLKLVKFYHNYYSYNCNPFRISRQS